MGARKPSRRARKVRAETGQALDVWELAGRETEDLAHIQSAELSLSAQLDRAIRQLDLLQSRRAGLPPPGA